MVDRLLLTLIAWYQKAISPLLPRSCRFYPTCSAYAAEAIREYGACRGICMALRRISRCHPWHPGGYDPVSSPSGTQE
ncbi:MAG: membrane protein insertion efficiency factor YidD [Firmicutes bacterium]|nr:membrane protein insertion efficiency factor YidD [Bacillota bacterium]